MTPVPKPNPGALLNHLRAAAADAIQWTRKRRTGITSLIRPRATVSGGGHANTRGANAGGFRARKGFTTAFTSNFGFGSGNRHKAIRALAAFLAAVLTAISAIFVLSSSPAHAEQVNVTPAGAYLYVANRSSMTVSVIDTATDTVVSTIPVGNHPEKVTVNPDGSRAYVTSDNESIKVINTATNTVVDTIDRNRGISGIPKGIVFTPDGRDMYITTGRSVQDFNFAADEVVGNISISGGINRSGISITPDGKHVYVTSDSSRFVTVIATATNSIADSIDLNPDPAPPTPPPARCDIPTGITTTPPNGRYAYVTCHDTVVAIDTGTSSVARVTNTAGQVADDAQGIAASPDGTRIYFVNFRSDTLSTVNTATKQIISTASVMHQPRDVAVSPDGSRIYVSNESSNTISVISSATNTATAITTSIKPNPVSIAVGPDGKHAYVANYGDNSTSVIDTGTNKVSTTVPVGTHPTTATVRPDGKYVYVAGDDTISALTPDASATTTIHGTGQEPSGLAVSNDNKFLFVSHFNSNNISVIQVDDAGSGIVKGTISITIPGLESSNPEGLAVGPDGTLYAAIFGSNILSVITNPASTSPTINSITVGSNPIDVAVSGSGVVYVANSNASHPGANGSVSVIKNPKTSPTVSTITNGIAFFVDALALSPDGSHVYVSNGVANGGTNTVTVIATSSGTVTATIAIPAQNSQPSSDPVDIAVNPDGRHAYTANFLDRSVSVITTDYAIPVGNDPNGLAIAQVKSSSVTAAGGSPQSTAVGTAFPDPLAAKVTDSTGKPLSGVAVTFSVPDGSATFSATATNPPKTSVTALTLDDGVATAPPLTALSNVASYAATAHVDGIPIDATYDLKNLGPSVLNPSGGSTSQSAQVNTAFATNLGVQVKDAEGHSVPNIPVTFRAPNTADSPSGTFANGTDTGTTSDSGHTIVVRSNESGLAIAPTFTANGKVGHFSVQATADSGDGSLVSVSFEQLVNTPGPAAKLVVDGSSSPQAALLFSKFANPLSLKVLDASNNPVPNVVVTFKVVPNGGVGGTLSAGTSTTMTDGSASVNLTAGSIGGKYKVVATAPGVADSAQFDVTNSTGPAFVSQGSTTFKTIGTNTFEIQAAGTPTPTVTAAGLPPGVTLTNSGAGDGKAILSGTPPFTGSPYTFDLTATNASGAAPVVQHFELTVMQAATTTTVAAPPTALPGQPVEVTITVDASVSPTGNVVLRDGTDPDESKNPVIGFGTLSAASGSSAAVTFSVSLTEGSHSLRASYVGGADNKFAPSTSEAVSVTTAKVPTNTKLSQNPAGGTIPMGQNVTFTATVTGDPVKGNPPDGSVSIIDTLLGSPAKTVMSGLSLDASTDKEAIVTVALSSLNLAAGPHHLTAHYAGSDAFQPSTSTPALDINIQASTTTKVSSSQNPSDPGQAVTFTATVTGSPGTPQDGTVVFQDGDTKLGEATLDNGIATYSTSSLAPRTHSITATYSGDDTYTGSTSEPITQQITKAASTVKLTSSLNPAAPGQDVTFTATVTGPTSGTITFKDGDTKLGDSQINNGTATYTTSNLTTGDHTITATYDGDDTHTGTTSEPITQQITKAASTVKLTSSLNPAAPGQDVTFTATVTGPTSGTITFKDGDTKLGDS
ncbi:Ig-like domain repeat protein, partial [Kitasatospora sp. NPDC048540]|uniref:Ig-like domain repeat protein n=1 Tax=Kitasatospora sp. NPDC048540 TaxID=3155634 RepID=UPI0033C6B1FC